MSTEIKKPHISTEQHHIPTETTLFLQKIITFLWNYTLYFHGLTHLFYEKLAIFHGTCVIFYTEDTCTNGPPSSYRLTKDTLVIMHKFYTYMKCTAAEWAKNLRTQWFTLISPRYCFVPICEYIIFTVHAVVYPIKIYDIFITKRSIYL